MRTRFFALMILAAACAGCGGGVSPKIARQILPKNVHTPVAHVFLVIEENRSYSTVYHNQMPWLSALGDKYGIATNFLSDEQGSLMEYLRLSSGSNEQNFGCDGNDCKQTVTDDNIFRELNKAGMSWKVYEDSFPTPGFMDPFSGAYVKRHNPAPWYSDVINDPAQQQKMVPFTQFAADLAADTLPVYSIIVPDLLDDAHDGSPQAADQWLEQNIGPLVNSKHFQAGSNSVMFITFDNADGDEQGKVFTAVVGSSVIPGVKVDTQYRHENTLRTIMELLGLTNFPGASSDAAPMKEFFK